MNSIASMLIVLCLGASFSETATAAHIRVQETSITENGRVQSEPDVRLQTKGYGATWIFPFGLGISYTQLETNGANNGSSVALKHSYIDASYTAGETWLSTFGFGVGVAGKATIDGQTSDEFRATSWSLGVGYRFSWFELYWINRLNYPRYRIDGVTVNVTSSHYQLGLGVKW